MRHAISRDETLVSKLKVSRSHNADHSGAETNSQCVDAASPDETSSQDGDSITISLRELFPTARFFCGDDVCFESIAPNADTASEAQLVVYRLGKDEPTKFISDALARGVSGILTEQLLPCPLPQCIVSDVECAVAEIASIQANRPDQKLLTIGVLGSHGKTTTSLLVSSLLRSDGIRTAYQSDLGQCDGLIQTTPRDSISSASSIVRWLGEAVDANCQASILELSDEKLRSGCFDAIEFDVLIVTGSNSKMHDFGPLGLQCGLDRLADDGVVIASADSPQTVEEIESYGARLVTYGVHRQADITAKIIEESGGMTTLAVNHGDVTAVMESRLCGGAMAGNHAAAAALGILVAQPIHKVVEVLGRLKDVPARQQRMDCFEHANVVIDAAGCPERVTETLQTMRRMKGAGRIWCVLAIEPSDSDDRLADYGHSIERFADQSIVTCRNEGKSHFLKDSHAILDGVNELASMRLSADHERAVRWAISSARSEDTVVLLGGITRNTAHQQRTEIDQVVGWVDSERKTLDDDLEKPKLSIFR